MEKLRGSGILSNREGERETWQWLTDWGCTCGRSKQWSVSCLCLTIRFVETRSNQYTHISLYILAWKMFIGRERLASHIIKNYTRVARDRTCVWTGNLRRSEREREREKYVSKQLIVFCFTQSICVCPLYISQIRFAVASKLYPLISTFILITIIINSKTHNACSL